MTHEIIGFSLDTDSEQLAVVCRCGWFRTLQFYSGPMHAIGDVMNEYVEHVGQSNRGVLVELRK